MVALTPWEKNKSFQHRTLLAACEQVEVVKAGREKSAFTSRHGLYQFTRMLFVLKNASAKFQCVMHIMYSSDKWQFVSLYPDDINIFTKTQHEYIAHIKIGLTFLEAFCVTLKRKKWCFSTSRIDCLGSVITPRSAQRPNQKLMLYES